MHLWLNLPLSRRFRSETISKEPPGALNFHSKASLLLPPWGELGRSPEKQRFGNSLEVFQYSQRWDGTGGGEQESFLQALR